MTTAQLWEYLFTKKLAETTPLDRHFIWVKIEDFAEIKNFFKKEHNPLQKGASYRSKSFWKHVHAVEKGKYVCAHFDYGNPALFPPLALIHFFRDVVPYYLFCRRNKKKFSDYFTPPLA